MFGFGSFLWRRFNKSQTCSIGFRSGLQDGQGSTLILLARSNCWVGVRKNVKITPRLTCSIHFSSNSALGKHSFSWIKFSLIWSQFIIFAKLIPRKNVQMPLKLKLSPCLVYLNVICQKNQVNIKNYHTWRFDVPVSIIPTARPLSSNVIRAMFCVFLFCRLQEMPHIKFHTCSFSCSCSTCKYNVLVCMGAVS